ncbi:peptidase S8/S53 domain-containing protein [Massariosphaeria phaeospora]|uniref:Peptidase S8/S53 domain-containing protein n=1 Tax=Massariosphaeria phaeospora TaxID=100035 RepID=A0A7C8MP58_9PLEO|nr:peptidase S8/S53 domain-containing protein [Massariosphaeria phaeospora]
MAAHGLLRWSFAILLGIAAASTASGRPQIVPGRYLVEFEDQHDQSSFASNLKRSQFSAQLRISIESTIFKGASYQFDSDQLGEDALQALASMRSVKNVWPVSMIRRTTDDVIWSGSDPGAIPEGIRKQVTGENGRFPPHIQTQVNRLHAEGLTGKGVKIGVVDTGVDYRHPALGGCFGPGCLIARGYDYTGDQDSLINDLDPFVNCSDHGTHVTGIIAAQPNEFGFLGAAPGAEIGMYRVFTCADEAPSDIVLAALNQAFIDGNHIITASLGGADRWSAAISVIAQRIFDKGVICTFAAGNSRRGGPFMVTHPASSKDGIAVGSVENSEIPYILLNATWSAGNSSPITFGWVHGRPSAWGNVSLPLYVGDLDDMTCDQFSNADNLTNHIVLLLPDICRPWYSSTYAARKGAKYVLTYGEGEKPPIVEFPDPSSKLEYSLPTAVGSLPYSVASKFVTLTQSGETLFLSITDPELADKYVDSLPNTGAGFMSSYSNWGPTFELDTKPDISIPGGSILSLFPLNQGGYGVMSGTSMATPLAAGIFALLIEARGELMTDLKNLVRSTSKPLNFLDSKEPVPYLAPVSQQGSGIAQAWDAVHANGIPSISKIVLNDTDHFVQTHDLTVKNVGNKSITYLFSNRGALTFYTLEPNSFSPAEKPQLLPRYATVKFSESVVTILPGNTTIVSLSFTPPADLDASRIAVYSGFITLDGSTGERLSISYQGVVGSMRNITNLGSAIMKEPDSGPNFILPKDPYTRTANVSYQYPSYTLNAPFGIPYVDYAVFSVSRNASTSGTSSLGEYLGSLPPFPLEFLSPLSQQRLKWNGLLYNGSRVAEGRYAFVIKGLRIFGDREKEEDYITQRLDDFGIEYL